MTKDPAVLFYTSDFLSGTFTMSNENVGKYVRLLCIQHQTGRLTKEEMLNVCGTYVKQVFDKFIEKDGLFFNKRMEEESIKRKLFCESRKKSRMSNVRQSYVQHTENENENENENIKTKDIKSIKDKNEIINISKGFIHPEIGEVRAYCLQRANTVNPQAFIDFYESKGWMIGKNKMKDWQAAVRTWEKNGYNKPSIQPTTNAVPVIVTGAKVPTNDIIVPQIDQKQRAEVSRLISETAKAMR